MASLRPLSIASFSLTTLRWIHQLLLEEYSADICGSTRWHSSPPSTTQNVRRPASEKGNRESRRLLKHEVNPEQSLGYTKMNLVNHKKHSDARVGEVPLTAERRGGNNYPSRSHVSVPSADHISMKGIIQSWNMRQSFELGYATFIRHFEGYVVHQGLLTPSPDRCHQRLTARVRTRTWSIPKAYHS
jgi:hypothetical protein